MPLELPPTPLEELPRPELDPEVLGDVLELGLEVLEPDALEPEVLGLELLPAALEPWRASQSVFAMPVRPTHEVEEPEPELEVLGEVVLLEPELLGEVVLLDPEVLGDELMLPLDPLVLGLAVLGLVALPDEPLPIEPLELPEVCATETPAAPRNAAATAAQRSLLVIVSLLEDWKGLPPAGKQSPYLLGEFFFMWSNPPMPISPRAAIFAAALLFLQACSSTLQTYSSPEHETRSLTQAGLREGGVAFLTPSTITGQEEDKQTLAYLFASTLRTKRPDVKVLPLSETIGAVNRAGLAETYRSMYRDYRDTAVFDASLLSRIAQAAGARYLAQLKLSQMQQGARGRLGLLGLSILNTQYASIRVSMQVWDSRDGSIAWEGIDEVTMAIDTGLEQPMPFRAVAERAAEDLVARLP